LADQLMSKSSGPICSFLIEGCDKALSALSEGRTRDAISNVRGRLDEPVLRVAVGGRLNAGKSTLVNSLLGEKLAATNATECTTLVSLYGYGLTNQVVVRFQDGQSVTLPGQPLPSALAAAGRPSAEVSVIEVRSSNAILSRSYTLVDTPGLDSLSGLDALSLRALNEADALLYVMPHPGEDDREALAALRKAAKAAGITPLRTIGVLSRIDQLGDGTTDPWASARRVAGRYGRQLSGLLSSVVPVAGLVAETALGDQFTEGDMRPLRHLHKFAAGSPADITVALRTADDFRAHPALPLPAGDRDRLLGMLGIYGIRVALGALDSGIGGAAGLLRALRQASGIDALLTQLQRQFVELADPLRARWAIEVLDGISWTAQSPAEQSVLARLRDDLGLVRGHLRIRQLDLMGSLTDLEAGLWEGPEGTSSELTALAAGASLHSQLGLAPAASASEVRARLVERITAWRIAENTLSLSGSRHARVIGEYLQAAYDSLPAG
jgi:hypothetical protein